ncbi:MAG: GTP 3',8-cyclase MoaA [Candidatus Omnitrophica bacterium]|nr:GTP 3',8-cyclase MoaA [Candidatus Omnitrophota bacterium]
MIQDQLSRPLHDLRISVIDRCNFRCPYCMPGEQFHHAYQFLDKDQWLSFDEITRCARIFVALGVKKLRLTGGEPLLRPDMDVLVRQLAAIEGVEDLALTTNGSMLTQWAPRLKQAGLKRLTVSLDSLDPAVFKQLSGDRGKVEDVLAGIKAAGAAGFKRIKINAVVQRGVNDHAIMDLVRYFRGTGHVLRFIEYMDVGNQNHWKYKNVVPSRDIIRTIEAVYPLEYMGGTEGGDTNERYRFKDGQGEIGFISSVSHAFCGTCNRLRLSAEGKMYTCLFATHGTDLKEHLRSGTTDDFLAHLIRVTWMKREDRYSELRSQLRQSPQHLPKVEMYHIGG